ncbi:MAG: glycosyltransferase family 4 protein, partial [Acidobacteriota bacterium]
HYERFLTRAVGVSEEICERYRDDCGIAADRVEWIPYGVETNECAPDDRSVRPLRLIYVGRLDEEQKRTSDLIKVVRRLSENGVDFQLSIVGDGEEMPAVKEGLAAEIALGRVTLFGWLDSSEVIEKLRAAEIFLLTSAYEGFCISLTESMANGCAPLVTDIKSGNKQLVRNGENGFVVPIGDVAAFVEKISYLDANRDKLLEFRQKAWETGREYSVERMVAAYERCFEAAAEDAKVNPRTPDPGFPLMESCRSRYPLWLRRIKARLVNS